MDMRRTTMTLQRWATATVGVLLLGACERALSPRTTRLAEIRRIAPDGYGTFTGRVLGSTGAEHCARTGQPVAGVRVELGEWHGIPAYYRDTLTREPPTSEAEPRFETLASTTTNEEGRFVFDSLPRRAPFAFRAFPLPDSDWQLTYGASLFGTGNVDLKDHPVICLRRSRLPGP